MLKAGLFPECSTRAQLVRIDAESGELKWDQAVGRDTFENEVRVASREGLWADWNKHASSSVGAVSPAAVRQPNHCQLPSSKPRGVLPNMQQACHDAY